MDRWPDRALRALTVYYERGLKALAELRAERYEDAEVLLNMRKAAFHNFRAADHLATKEGYGAKAQEELLSLWRQIQPLDADLMAELVTARDRTQVQLMQIAKVRAALSRFRSSEAETNSFEKSV